MKGRNQLIENVSQKLSNFFTKAIIWLGIVFSAVIFVVATMFTTKIVNYYGEDMNIIFAPYIVIGAIIFLLIFTIPPVRRFLTKIPTKTVLRVVLIWGFFAALTWVMIADVLPMWDSQDLIYAADAINGSRDILATGKWAPGSYVEHFPFQTPLIFYIALLQHVAGGNFIILFQILNCIACAVSMYFIVKITDNFFKNSLATSIAAILVMLFLPIIFYCTFIYGNILSLPFVLACWYFQKRAMDTKKIWRFGLLSAFLGVIACLFKSTMSFAVIASAVVWIVWAISQKKIKPVFVALISLVLIKISIFPFYLAVGANTELNLAQNGLPSIAWITMGIGGGKEYNADISENDTIRYEMQQPGYFDGFVWALKSEDYSKEAASELSYEYLDKRIQHFQADPGLFFQFFGRKLAIEWTEPTFESILANNWCSHASANNYSMCTRNHTFFTKAIFNGPLDRVVIGCLDCLQTVILLGLVVCLFAQRKVLNIAQLAPLICILGMAFVYIFWENKTQYILPAYLFMIPYSGLGINIILQRLSQSRILVGLYSRRKSSRHTRQLTPKKSSVGHPKSKQNK